MGDRYEIPQWEHTSHCGFVQILDVGSPGRWEGKVRVLFPDLTSPWVSERAFQKQHPILVREGEGSLVPADLDDFWCEGEMEPVYERNIEVWKSKLVDLAKEKE